ncbi:MAG: hypothetical protein JWP49_1650 [Phenylobacterium sp.]|jgi:hypothetical protein|nr:hypothetical protein [Phenylobacterium sp.]
MTTLTGFVASVVVHSSAAAFSHFGLTLEPMHMDRPAAERVVARSHAAKVAADCPERLARSHIDHT